MASVTNCEKELQDMRVKNSLKYLDKHGFEYKETDAPTIVNLKYPTGEYGFSLDQFKIYVNKTWIRKERGKLLLKPGTEIEFGKYKGKKMNEINDPDYIKWLLHATNTMIHPDCFLKTKLTN